MRYLCQPERISLDYLQFKLLCVFYFMLLLDINVMESNQETSS